MGGPQVFPDQCSKLQQDCCNKQHGSKTKYYKWKMVCIQQQSSFKCRFLLLSESSIHFLTLLGNHKKPSQQRGSILELSPKDLNQFHILNKELQVALKHSQKQSGKSDGY